MPERFDSRTHYSSTPLLQHSFAFDNAPRLTNVTDGTYSAAYAYLANSPLVSQITLKSNTTLRMTTTKQYDYLNRLLSSSSAPSAQNQLPITHAYVTGRFKLTHLRVTSN